MEIVVICNVVFIYIYFSRSLCIYYIPTCMYIVQQYIRMHLYFNVQFAMSILAISLDTLGSASIRLINLFIYTKLKRCVRQVSKAWNQQQQNKKTGINGIARAKYVLFFYLWYTTTILLCAMHHILSTFERNETKRSEMRRKMNFKASYQWFCFHSFSLFLWMRSFTFYAIFLAFFDLHFLAFHAARFACTLILFTLSLYLSL